MCTHSGLFLFQTLNMKRGIMVYIFYGLGATCAGEYFSEEGSGCFKMDGENIDKIIIIYIIVIILQYMTLLYIYGILPVILYIWYIYNF